jgi:hypothetical protein
LDAACSDTEETEAVKNWLVEVAFFGHLGVYVEWVFVSVETV